MYNYARNAAQHPDFLSQVKAFVAHDDRRSAVVTELLLPNTSPRRPLRPEDLDFLKFDKAVDIGGRSRLEALAAGRILYCLNEVASDGAPLGNGLDTDQIRPVLESVAFEYLAAGAELHGPDLIGAHDLVLFFEQRARDYRDIFRDLQQSDYLYEGLGLALIQNYFPRVRTLASATAVSSAWLFPAAEAQYARNRATARVVEPLLQAANLDERSFYWQFYLPTTLTRINLPWSVALSSASEAVYLGVCAALELDFRAFLGAIEQVTKESFGSTGTGLFNPALQKATALDVLVPAFTAMAPQALSEFHAGFVLGREMSDAALWDLSTQLAWLRRIDLHVEAAGLIAERIDCEWPDIDRDTFVEPRDMCSTTHVHDDHRLVMIEEGDMIFWGAPNMRHKMFRGDKILIPAGRLHGSTVVSPECVYHQPIIPDSWVGDVFAQLRGRQSLSKEVA